MSSLEFRLEKKRTSITRLKQHEPNILSDCRFDLKRKEPRLRDWNKQPRQDVNPGNPLLEKKRTSITRLKRTRRQCHGATSQSWKEKNLDYEIETKSLPSTVSPVSVSWKEKNLDYEIETQRTVLPKLWFFSPWKEKNLDYEIETVVSGAFDICINILKRKEPRLRDWNLQYGVSEHVEVVTLKRKEPRLRDWNVSVSTEAAWASISLKRKEPRLRDWNSIVTVWRVSVSHLKRKEPRLRDWNRQYLGVRSPIFSHLKRKEPRLRDWNWCRACWIKCVWCILKRKEPRLRDWNFLDIAILNGEKWTWKEKNLDYEIETCRLCHPKRSLIILKRKEPRLRDWNPQNQIFLGHSRPLEKKRTSITRLKRITEIDCMHTAQTFTWKEKNLDYEIETCAGYF